MAASSFTALFDACVLYPAPLRDLLMRVAMTEVFRARWTEQIHAEWMRGVRESRPDISPEQLERTRELMNRHVPHCLVTGYEGLIDGLTLPDPDDRHVLAAAIRSQAQVIVTFNLKDFPAAALAPYEIEAEHPDAFLGGLLDLHAGEVMNAALGQWRSLKNPPHTRREFLATLERQGLIQTARALGVLLPQEK